MKVIFTKVTKEHKCKSLYAKMRGKALDIRSHYLRHLIASRQVDYRHMPGSENPADVMTKQEHFPAFQRMRSRMNIR